MLSPQNRFLARFIGGIIGVIGFFVFLGYILYFAFLGVKTIIQFLWNLFF